MTVITTIVAWFRASLLVQLWKREDRYGDHFTRIPLIAGILFLITGMLITYGLIHSGQYGMLGASSIAFLGGATFIIMAREDIGR